MRMMKQSVAKATSIATVVLVCSASAQAAVDWTFRYEGDVLPTTAGSIAFSDGTVSQFGTSGGTPLVSTDGDILNFAPQPNIWSVISHRAKFPATTGASLLLDPAIGYTIEFRARLNSVDAGVHGAATVQIPSGVTNSDVYMINLFDTDMDPSNGYGVKLTTTGASSFGANAGFNTIRLAVLGNEATLWINGFFAVTDTTGGRALNINAIRVGDFTSLVDADWDLDYLYAFDGGAVAPEVLVGDLNLDGFVGISDMNIVLGNWNQTVPPGAKLLGDPTGDGFVGIEDLNWVLGNWNDGTPPANGAAIPEPATLALLGLGGLAMLRRRARG